VEDKEKRNMTLMDDLMRVRASEKLQIEKTAAIERRGQAFDALRRQQEDALKALQVGGWGCLLWGSSVVVLGGGSVIRRGVDHV
jgi:hypothetical protein